jgi:hypothetical protein
VVVSLLSTLTLIYQTHVIGDQYSATIWPYLSINATYSLHSGSIDVENDGLGPALIKSATLFVDGKRASDWSAYLRRFAHDPLLRAALIRSRNEVLAHRMPEVAVSASSIGSGSTIRPGATTRLLTVVLPASINSQVFTEHAIALEFCYCSLNDRCWTLHAIAGSDDSATPVAVASCDASSRISSAFPRLK